MECVFYGVATPAEFEGGKSLSQTKTAAAAKTKRNHGRRDELTDRAQRKKTRLDGLPRGVLQYLARHSHSLGVSLCFFSLPRAARNRKKKAKNG